MHLQLNLIMYFVFYILGYILIDKLTFQTSVLELQDLLEFDFMLTLLNL